LDTKYSALSWSKTCCGRNGNPKILLGMGFRFIKKICPKIKLPAFPKILLLASHATDLLKNWNAKNLVAEDDSKI